MPTSSTYDLIWVVAPIQETLGKDATKQDKKKHKGANKHAKENTKCAIKHILEVRIKSMWSMVGMQEPKSKHTRIKR